MSYPDDPGPVGRRRRGSAPSDPESAALGRGLLTIFLLMVASMVVITLVYNWAGLGSADPPAAAPTSPPGDTAAAPAVVEQQPEVWRTPEPDPDGADVAGEHAAPSATPTPTPPSASGEPEVRERLEMSQARSAEPGWRPDEYWFGLALGVSGSRLWAGEYVVNTGCESTNGAHRVTYEANGTVSRGPNSINDVWADRFDLLRLIHDDLYAVQSAFELWSDDGTWDYWAEVCRP